MTEVVVRQFTVRKNMLFIFFHAFIFFAHLFVILLLIFDYLRMYDDNAKIKIKEIDWEEIESRIYLAFC